MFTLSILEALSKYRKDSLWYLWELWQGYTQQSKYIVLAGELAAERERHRPALKPDSADVQSPHRPYNTPRKVQIAVCLSPSAVGSKQQPSAAATAATGDNERQPSGEVVAMQAVGRSTASMQKVCHVAPAFTVGPCTAQGLEDALHAALCLVHTSTTIELHFYII